LIWMARKDLMHMISMKAVVQKKCVMRQNK
jgi:hypothetical protein